RPLELRQIGPGQYRSNFQADQGGSFLVNLRYRRTDDGEKDQLVQSVITVPFAPEFEDLTDNAALMAEVARMTGGRVLPTDPARAELFSRSGLSLPRTDLPLRRPLLLAWVVLFLLDVAVRRLVIDFRAAGVRMLRLLRLRGPAEGSSTLAALKRRRSRLHRRWAAAGEPDEQARRRFEPPPDGPAELPRTDLAKPRRKPRQAAADEAADKAAGAGGQAGASDEQTHLRRLLDAKRRAGRRRHKED
ncbi:MAG: hypothetical protein J7M21_01815, partial [Planctomycetes bacterium]|nr:hypothetical protein [Planctomycetota bacterium]